MEFHRSAFKLDRDAILHGPVHALVVVELEPASDPPRVLAIGAEMVIHAMPLRPPFHALLPTLGDSP